MQNQFVTPALESVIPKALEKEPRPPLPVVSRIAGGARRSGIGGECTSGALSKALPDTQQRGWFSVAAQWFDSWPESGWPARSDFETQRS